ncbi:hypothetical protein BBP40_005406 [Aspergillus hancockii]|nr:hypothetical protein BBP40_005406 [Aspergillus hancockii]
MGGNQALHDCADMLPQLLALDQMARDEVLSITKVQEACLQYEFTMLGRAFTWVQKSGGISAVNINLDGFLGTLLFITGKVVVPVLVTVHWALRPFGLK